MNDRNDIPPGDHTPEVRKSGMERSDRILLIVAAVIVGGGFILAALLLQGIIVELTGIAAGIGTGVGFLGALPIALVLSIMLMVVFGLVAGDTIGELPTMLLGFFLMTGFFTIVISVIY